MRMTMLNLSRPLKAVQFLFLASTVALATAYISQFVFGLKPCHLCLLQRIPYGVMLFLSGLGFICYKKPAIIRWVVWLGILALTVEVGLAAYHTGVEYGVFHGLEGCSSGDIPEGGMTLEEIKQQIMSSDIVRCDQPAFVFLGLSMAGWNTIYSSLALLGVLWTLLSGRKKHG